jgi:uncharacterized protein (DUF2141 family)
VLTVSKGGTGSGTVTSSPAGISCGADCSEIYTSGTSVTLTASAAAGSTFGSWNGCDSTNGPTCTVAMNAAKNPTVNFDTVPSGSYALTISKAGTGSGTVTSSPAGISCGADCTETYTSGTSVTLTASAAAGSTFGSWTGCDSTNGATCTVAMNAARNPAVTFNAVPSGSYALTVSKAGTGSGTVTSSPAGINCGADCTEAYTSGTSVTLTASAAAGSTIGSWTGCDSSSGTACTVNMTVAKTVTATFNPVTPMYQLTALAASSSPSYTVSWSCPVICSNVSVLQEAPDTSFTSPAIYNFASNERSKAFTGKAAGTYCYRVSSGSEDWSNTTCTTVASCPTLNQTRCVAGDINVVETCTSAGWNQSNCPTYSLCSSDACRTVCEMTSTPTSPTLCIVPNADGKNNGEWAVWSDSKLAVPAYASGGSTNNTNNRAPVYTSGQTWPYAWSISSSYSAYVQFKLNQFGGTRSPRLAFRAKRAGVLTQNVNNYIVGVFNGNTSIGTCNWGPVPYAYANDSCTVTSPYNAQLNYSGGLNSLLFSITGDGFGGTIDLLDVNYIKLIVP